MKVSKYWPCTLRVLVVGLVASVAATILWLTPIPDPFFKSCVRPCHELDWPMICRVRLTLEVYQTLSNSCGRCPENQTDCWSPHCVTADGHRRGILTANRQLPGPAIQVCENDIVVVDVVNRVPGHGVAVHWRGLPQRDTPFMDGVPMLTQCPIPSYTTFQYKFRASRPGTHLWHAHEGAEMADGLAGLLVVRRSPRREPHQALYDEDLAEHALLLTEWSRGGFALQRLLQDPEPKPDTLLLNGRGRGDAAQVPLTELKVRSGKRFRFRVAHAGVISACAIRFSIEGHNLTIIEVDGSPVHPRAVQAVTFASGERIDFVLHADQPPGAYEVLAESQCSPEVVQRARLIYLPPLDESTPHCETDMTSSTKVPDTKTAMTSFTSPQVLDTGTEDCGDPEDALLCLGELEALDPVHPELSKDTTDVTLQLPFDFTPLEKENNTAALPNVHVLSEQRLSHVSNLSFVFPPSPLVTQAKDVPPELFCHAQSRPSSCTSQSSVCECVHQVDLPLGSSVELQLLDFSNEGGSHVFHLHGHSFHVARRVPGITSVSLSPAKDSVTVPPGGRAVIRFMADNPGYWLLRDQHVSHAVRGLSVILHVGGPWDLPASPSDFPRCGSWRGPDFFLA